MGRYEEHSSAGFPFLSMRLVLASVSDLGQEPLLNDSFSISKKGPISSDLKSL